MTFFIEPETALERFVNSLNIVASTGCWEWTAALSHNGYADRIMDNGSRYRPTHYALLIFKGMEVPDGMTVDHLCRNRSCVRPLHLDIVTPSENERRKHDTPTCRRGHPWTPENTYIKPNGNRNCVACRRIHQRTLAARRRRERAENG